MINKQNLGIRKWHMLRAGGAISANESNVVGTTRFLHWFTCSKTGLGFFDSKNFSQASDRFCFHLSVRYFWYATQQISTQGELMLSLWNAYVLLVVDSFELRARLQWRFRYSINGKQDRIHHHIREMTAWNNVFRFPNDASRTFAKFRAFSLYLLNDFDNRWYNVFYSRTVLEYHFRWHTYRKCIS